MQPENDGPIMVVTDNPLKEDDEIGYQLVGRAGKMFDTILNQAGLGRKDVYLTNTVKCCSKPTQKQAEFCSNNWLKQEILDRNPRWVVCLGKLSGANLLKIPMKAVKIQEEPYHTDRKIFVGYSLSSLLNKGKSAMELNVNIFKRIVDDK